MLRVEQQSIWLNIWSATQSDEGDTARAESAGSSRAFVQLHHLCNAALHVSLFRARMAQV